MRHWKCLHGHVADAELGAGAKDSPVTMLLEQFVAPNRLRRKRVAINRHLQLATKNFESADVIAVFVSEKHATQLIGRGAALRETKHRLQRAEAAIAKNLAMIHRLQCARSVALAADYRHTEDGDEVRVNYS